MSNVTVCTSFPRNAWCKKYSTFLLYLLIHNFISPVHHIYKPFLNIYYPIIKVYRSGQFECNCITDLSLNIQPTISLQPLTLYRYGVDRSAHMLSMIDGFIVHIHGHVSGRPWVYWVWNCWSILFCGHKGQCTSWSNWLKLCINLYVCNMSALCLRYTKVGNFSRVKRSVYVSVRSSGTSLVALRWILSMASESLFGFGNHMLIMALYNWRNIVDVEYLNVCLRHPKILLAVATWVWTCIENFSWLSIVTPRFFSIYCHF